MQQHQNINKNTNNMAQQKQNLATKIFAKLICVAMLLPALLLPNLAQADFRKALTAYQNRDGKTMLAEVQDAVDKKNDDGLVLFLSVLEADAWIAKDYQFVGKPLTVQSPVEKLLNKKELDSLVNLLSNSVIQNSSVSQFRFYWFLVILGNDYRSKFSGMHDKAYTSGISTQDEIAEAVLYLRGRLGDETINAASMTETKGLKLLKKALARPDAYLYWGRYSSSLAQYYYDKYLQKKNTYFLRQAYSWAVLHYTHYIFFNNYQPIEMPIILEIQKNGLLVKLAPELNTILSDAPKSYDRKLREQHYQKILQNVEHVELPDLIRKNHKIDLNKQPVLSLRRINYDAWRVMVDSVYMQDAGTSVMNFSLEVYQDGRVIFTQGHRGLPQFNRVQNSEVLLKISPEEVNNLTAEVKRSGIVDMPKVTLGTEDFGFCTTKCYSLEDTVAFASNYIIGFRDSKRYREVKFLGSNLTPSFAKVIQLLEERIPTQHYRCGTDKKSAYYPFCVNRDKQLFDIADQLNNK